MGVGVSRLLAAVPVKATSASEPAKQGFNGTLPSMTSAAAHLEMSAEQRRNNRGGTVTAAMGTEGGRACESATLGSTGKVEDEVQRR